MIIQSINRNFCILLVLILSVICSFGCATIPPPQSPDSSMIILSMKGKRKPFNVNVTPTQVFIANIDEKGYVIAEIPDTYQKGKYYYFTNMAPGNYRISRGIFSKTTTASSSHSRYSGRTGVTFTTGVSKTRITNYTFSDELRKRTEVRLSPGQIAYMGHFSFIDSVKIIPPGEVKVTETSGGRKKEDEEEALQYFKKSFKKSSWVTDFNN